MEVGYLQLQCQELCRPLGEEEVVEVVHSYLQLVLRLVEVECYLVEEEYSDLMVAVTVTRFMVGVINQVVATIIVTTVAVVMVVFVIVSS